MEMRRDAAKLSWCYKAMHMDEGRFPRLIMEATWRKVKRRRDVKS